MTNEIEPRSPRSTVSKIWECPKIRGGKSKNWALKNKRNRGQVAELAPVIKPVAFGSKVYKFGPYTGSLEEIKEFAAMKGICALTNGAIKYKIA